MTGSGQPLDVHRLVTRSAQPERDFRRLTGMVLWTAAAAMWAIVLLLMVVALVRR
jgi:hypothetical protein